MGAFSLLGGLKFLVKVPTAKEGALFLGTGDP